MARPVNLPPESELLPDTSQWHNRFTYPSESTDVAYVVAQNRTTGAWGCSCPRWRFKRTCKHLRNLGLEANETVELRPYAPVSRPALPRTRLSPETPVQDQTTASAGVVKRPRRVISIGVDV